MELVFLAREAIGKLKDGGMMRDGPNLEVCFLGEGIRLGKKLTARRENGRHVSKALLIATGVREKGYREILYAKFG